MNNSLLQNTRLKLIENSFNICNEIEQLDNPSLVLVNLYKSSKRTIEHLYRDIPVTIDYSTGKLRKQLGFYNYYPNGYFELFKEYCIQLKEYNYKPTKKQEKEIQDIISNSRLELKNKAINKIKKEDKSVNKKSIVYCKPETYVYPCNNLLINSKFVIVAQQLYNYRHKNKSINNKYCEDSLYKILTKLYIKKQSMDQYDDVNIKNKVGSTIEQCFNNVQLKSRSYVGYMNELFYIKEDKIEKVCKDYYNGTIFNRYNSKCQHSVILDKYLVENNYVDSIRIHNAFLNNTRNGSDMYKLILDLYDKNIYLRDTLKLCKLVAPNYETKEEENVAVNS